MPNLATPSILAPSIRFTDQLVPRTGQANAPLGKSELLPLIRHWVLALISHTSQPLNELINCKVFDGLCDLEEAEKPAKKRSRSTNFADIMAESASEQRRKDLRFAELMAQVRKQVDASGLDFSHSLFGNLQALGNLLGLNATELVVLCVMVLLDEDSRFRDSIDKFCIHVEAHAEFVHLLAQMTHCSSADIHLALQTDSALLSMGLIKLEYCRRQFMGDCFELADGLAGLLMREHPSVEPIINHFLTPRAPGSLDTTHFLHLEDEIRTIVGVLGQAMQQGIPGTNILLYGKPGTGKTELVAAIAKALKADIFEVGYADKKGIPIRGNQRLQSYSLCQRVLGRRHDALVLFDEVEDMLEDGETPGKAWVNRALEQNLVPSVWITNNVQAMDIAYRRRFDYSLHVGAPPRSVRQRIARHHLGDIATGTAADPADPAWLEALVESADLTPGQMQHAAKVARLVECASLAQGQTEPAQARVVQALKRSAELLGQKKLRAGREMATAYDLAYLHTDAPIPQLVESLRMAPGGSMCFYGPPGAGKTALARHIADALELPVVLRRGSDLLSMYVGGTEQNIAEMFTAAAAEPSVLILDEADSFLQSRTQARHSWEVTQVNELLTQMEEYEGLFVCTTNLLDRLDAASLRRFDWKIGFFAMTASQRWAFFLQELHLLGGNIEAAQPLQARVRQQLNAITLGDFAPVSRQFRLLRRTPSAQEYFERLHAELAAKSGGAQTPLVYLDTPASGRPYSQTLEMHDEAQ